MLDGGVDDEVQPEQEAAEARSGRPGSAEARVVSVAMVATAIILRDIGARPYTALHRTRTHRWSWPDGSRPFQAQRCTREPTVWKPSSAHRARNGSRCTPRHSRASRSSCTAA